MIRGTIGLLAYTSIGLAPALVRMLAEDIAATPGPPTPADAIEPTAARPQVLSYATEASFTRPDQRVIDTYASGSLLALILGLTGLALRIAYGKNLSYVHEIPSQIATGAASELAVLFGFGMVFRMMSEAPGGLLQVRGQIALDNVLVAASELAWPSPDLHRAADSRPNMVKRCGIDIPACQSGAACRARNGRAPSSYGPGGDCPARACPSCRRCCSYGFMVMLAQTADFLYAPANYIIINRLLDPSLVADYAPAVQIDAGLLLLVTGVAAVLLPKTALAHTSGDIASVRRYYLTGTFLTTVVLRSRFVAVWALSPWILQLWLGNSMPAMRVILPLVLIHTVVGGSSAVGRSVLLGMGKVKPFTAAVLIAGVANVILSVLFAWCLGWGLRGIVLGTIIAVVGRCAIWMPWYVLRTIRRGMPSGPARIAPEAALG